MNMFEFHRIDETNPGDWFSNPCRYFFPELETTKVEIDIVKKTIWHQKDAIIVGGGGLLGNENFDNLMLRLLTHPDMNILEDILETKLKNASSENKNVLYKWKESIQKLTLQVMENLDKKVGPRILWGAGHNSKEKDVDSYSVEYPSYIKKFHLVGIRDYDVDYRWVPCSSCMDPAFDKEYEITNEIVWFEHKKRLIDTKFFDIKSVPRMINTGKNMEQIIEFLGSAETVVTNSYHGVYWATLLGRKVVCVPWGSKFHMFKHPPVMATERNWVEMVNNAIAYPEALNECKEANIEFFADVEKLLKEYNFFKND